MCEKKKSVHVSTDEEEAGTPMIQHRMIDEEEQLMSSYVDFDSVNEGMTRR